LADHAQTRDRRPVGELPAAEHFIERRVQLLVGRIPGLHDVAVEPDLVDGVDRHLGVRIRSQEDLACDRGVLEGRPEHVETGDLRHALVGHDQRQRLAPLAQLLDRGDGLLAVGRSEDAVVPAVFGPEVPEDGVEHLGLVIDREDGWSCAAHASTCPE
jgi:hypothetical protein